MLMMYMEWANIFCRGRRDIWRIQVEVALKLCMKDSWRPAYLLARFLLLIFFLFIHVRLEMVAFPSKMA